MQTWVKWPEGQECPVSGEVEVRIIAGLRHCRTAEALLSALEKQEGGSHYKDCPIQPVEYIHANDIGYFEGNVIKYVTRWRKKNGVEDLRKARHYLDLLIDLETRAASATVKS